MKRIFSPLSIFFAFFSGLGIGALVQLLFCAHFGVENLPAPSFLARFDSPTTAQLAAYGLYGLIGVASFASGALYKGKNLSLESLLHLGLNFVIIFITGSILGWFDLSFFSVAVFVLIFLLIYALIWFIMYQQAKREVDEINHSLKH